MKQLSAALLFLFVLKTSSAQLPEHQWSKAFFEANEYNPSVYSNGRAVAVDRQGNVYSTGQFDYKVDFDPGPGQFILTAATWANKSIFVTKLSPNGNFLWAFQIASWVEWGNIDITVDNNGNVYVASELRDTADFDPGPGVFNLMPKGVGWDAFIAKYDPNGNLVWAKKFQGPGDTCPRSDAVAVDNNNNVIICGNFNNTVDFDPGPGTFNLTSTAHIQSYIVKLTSNGDFIWAKQFGNSPVVHHDSNIADVKCDAQGNIYTVGNFSGLCDFDPGPGTYTLNGTSMNDGYIAKLTPNGDLTWAKRIGNPVPEEWDFAVSRGLTLDNAGNVYTAGNFRGIFDFDPGTNTHLITSRYDDWYVLKLNNQGNFIWVATMGGTDGDECGDVEVDNTGNAYAIGRVGRIADMDPGPGVFNLTSVGPYGSSAIVKLNSSGGFVAAGPFDGAGSCLTSRSTMDHLNNIYITGYMYGTIDFDPGPNVSTVSGQTYSPMVVKLAKCNNATTATLNISACNNYTLNNQTYDTSGTYYTTIPNAANCDSVITLHLTINKKSSQQNIAICQGSSFFAGGADQITAGTYIDTLRSSLNCDSIVTTYLTVNAAPKPDLGSDKNICTGTQASFNAGSFASYLWQDGCTAQTFTANQAGTYYVTVEDNRKCTGSDTVRINAVLPLPAGFLPVDTAICSYGTLLLKPRESFSTYLWSTSATSSSITLAGPGTYWLQVKDAQGCIGRDSIYVTRKECLTGFYMPNAFTPDNNRSNDVFKPIIGGVITRYELTVYNRWGQVVFASNNPGKGWDGTFNGALQDTNVFGWVCTYQLQGQPVKVAKGTVTLIR